VGIRWQARLLYQNSVSFVQTLLRGVACATPLAQRSGVL